MNVWLLPFNFYVFQQWIWRIINFFLHFIKTEYPSYFFIIKKQHLLQLRLAGRSFWIKGLIFSFTFWGKLLVLIRFSLNINNCIVIYKQCFVSLTLYGRLTEYGLKSALYSSVIRLVLPFMTIRVLIRTNTEHFSVHIQYVFHPMPR